MSRIIRRKLSDEPRLIGDRRGDYEATVAGERMLAHEFSEILTEVSAEGARYIPLKETLKFKRREIALARREHERGLAEGHKAGREEGRAEAQKVFQEFSGAVQAALGQRESMLREAEANILELILKIARKVTFDAAEIDPSICVQVIKGAIDSLVDKREIAVTVHPDHLPRMRELLEEFKSLSTDIRKFTLESDSQVGYGGCFIRTPTGDIDARLASQFAILEESTRSE